MQEVFESAIRSRGDYAGVFEADFDTAYFYLYQLSGDEGKKILDSVKIHFDDMGISENDVVVKWDFYEIKVGLFIKGQLWAVFDVAKNSKHAFRYLNGVTPHIPRELKDGF